MINSSMTIAGLQSQFKKSFDDAEKELDVGILHVERALDVGGNARIEVVDLKKKVSESFAKIKKIVMKFNSSALFFIGLNVDPLNPRLHEFLTADCNDLSVISRRIRKNRNKERSAVSQRESQKVKPPKPKANTVKRQKLFAPDEPRKGSEIPDSAAGTVRRTTSVHVDLNVDCKQVALDVNMGPEGVQKSNEKTAGGHTAVEGGKDDAALGAKKKKKSLDSEVYTDQQMEVFLAQLSPSSDEGENGSDATKCKQLAERKSEFKCSEGDTKLPICQKLYEENPDVEEGEIID